MSAELPAVSGKTSTGAEIAGKARSTLLLRLMGAFLMVILIGALVIYYLTSQATENAFRVYTTRSSQMWAQRLAPAYAEYYSTAGSWEGVDSFIQGSTLGDENPGMMGAGHGRGMGMNGWMGGMDQRLILADATGTVIADTDSDLTGSQLSGDELADGAPINAGGAQVGTLIVAPALNQTVPDPASDFIASVNRSILISVAVASAISLLIVLLLSLQITAPIRQMQKAASAIAAGDLSQQVPVRTNDELGALARSFNHMAGSLSAAEDQRRKLIADIAHELRTPTAVIQAHTEGIQDGVLPLDLAQVNAIHQETLMLGRLIEDLRLITMAEAGELLLEQTTVDLGDLLRLAVERARPQCQQKDVTLELQVSGNLPPVRADGDRITQVINNLVSNSLRYTPPGGTIRIEAWPEVGSAVVSVTDTGSGIPTGDLPKIFDRFYRADRSRARASGGTGLGLAIVRQLIEAHGGKVTAESPVFTGVSEEGYGSRVTFTLPAA